jgi:ankyrin repeat protein
MHRALVHIWLLFIFLGWSVPLSALDKEEKSAIEAIKNGDVGGLKAYLDKHPGLNCEFSDGKTGLYYAIEFDRDRICEFLLKRGADPDFTVGDHTLLNWAVRYDRRRIARFLIEYGADVNLPDKNSDSPLIYAAKFNSLELCSILTNRGANPF